MSNRFITRLFYILLTLGISSSSLLAQSLESSIQAYLREIKPNSELTDQDIASWRISDQYTNRKTGVTYTYLQQHIGGIPIFNAISTVALRNSRVVHFANRFHNNAAAAAKGSPNLSAENAVLVAAAHLGFSIPQGSLSAPTDERSPRWEFEAPTLSTQKIQAELYYVPVGSALRLAWNIIIAPLHTADWWNIRIDAQDGRFIEKNNWTAYCKFEDGHEHTEGQHSPVKILPEPAPASPDGNSSSVYNVYALPLESPAQGSRSILTDPHSLLASPYGWHDTDGVDGPEYTITRGNNVHAYEDHKFKDWPGTSPDGGPALYFNYPIDFTQHPFVSQHASITNLFYLSNAVHDILYEHGFDEEAGNFQKNNYGHGGLGEDYVIAEAQDAGASNFSTFSTPPDGYSAKMQLSLWSNHVPAVLTLNSPVSISYQAMQSSFGPYLTAPITSDLVFADDGGTTNFGCSPIINNLEVNGKIAVMHRGGCDFPTKIRHAEAAGAIAVLMINEGPGIWIMSGNGDGGENIHIPSVMVSQADGMIINDLMLNGTTNVTLTSGGGPLIDKDGALDNLIAAHEYGHGLTMRLTGGPSTTNCLFNSETGNEGWSDWLGLVLTIKPGDVGETGRSIGTYELTQDSTGAGLRRFPYSTNMNINPLTYADLKTSSGLEAIGEIWNQALWDMTWKLIDTEGFDPDWHTGTGGNITAMNLVIEAMKLQPCRPGFLDARDAILKADEILYNNAHRCLIWEAFARRGMGGNAAQGSFNYTGDEVPGFELPNICITATQAPKAKFSVNTAVSCTNPFRFTDLSTDLPVYYTWDFGDGTFSTSTNPEHTFSSAGTYPVVLTVENAIGSDSDTLFVTYAPVPTPVVSGDTAICAGEATTLSAAASTGNTMVWLENGKTIFEGNTFQTPALDSSITYTAQQVEIKPALHVGPVNNGFGAGSNHKASFEGRLFFEAFSPFRLLSVLVYANKAGLRGITLYDGDYKVLQTRVVNLPNGPSRVDLDLDIPAAGHYSIANYGEDLYRNTSGAKYPYTINNLVSIYKSNAVNNELNYYYYFYDWEVQEKPCTSAAVDVPVNVSPALGANFSAAADQLLVNFTNQSTGNPSSFSWKFGDGDTSHLQNPAHLYAAEGTYTVELTISDGNCSNTFTQTITVLTSAAGETAGTSRLRIYPNPADAEVTVDFQRSPAGPVEIKLYDAAGRLSLARTYIHPDARIAVNTSELAAGIYQIQISGEAGVSTQKITLQH